MTFDGVTLIRRPEEFADAVDGLRRLGFTVARLDAGDWTGDDDLHRDIAAALDFPDYYGRNLDALNDCLGDVAGYAYGTTPEAAGLLLAFERFDAFAGRRPRTARVVLDIIAEQGRAAAALGHRWVCLVQSDADPR